MACFKPKALWAAGAAYVKQPLDGQTTYSRKHEMDESHTERATDFTVAAGSAYGLNAPSWGPRCGQAAASAAPPGASTGDPVKCNSSPPPISGAERARCGKDPPTANTPPHPTIF